MSIPNSFKPLGTLGGMEPTPPSGWRVIEGCLLQGTAGESIIDREPCPTVDPSRLNMCIEFEAARGNAGYSFCWVFGSFKTKGGMNPTGGYTNNNINLAFNDGTSTNEYDIPSSTDTRRIRMELDKLNLRYIVDGQVVFVKRITDLALPSYGGTIFLQHIGVPFLFKRIQYCADDVKILYRAVQNVTDGSYAVCELYSGTIFSL